MFIDYLRKYIGEYFAEQEALKKKQEQEDAARKQQQQQQQQQDQAVSPDPQEDDAVKKKPLNSPAEGREEKAVIKAKTDPRDISRAYVADESKREHFDLSRIFNQFDLNVDPSPIPLDEVSNLCALYHEILTSGNVKLISREDGEVECKVEGKTFKSLQDYAAMCVMVACAQLFDVRGKLNSEIIALLGLQEMMEKFEKEKNHKQLERLANELIYSYVTQFLHGAVYLKWFLEYGAVERVAAAARAASNEAPVDPILHGVFTQQFEHCLRNVGRDKPGAGKEVEAYSPLFLDKKQDYLFNHLEWHEFFSFEMVKLSMKELKGTMEADLLLFQFECTKEEKEFCNDLWSARVLFWIKIMFLIQERNDILRLRVMYDVLSRRLKVLLFLLEEKHKAKKEKRKEKENPEVVALQQKMAICSSILVPLKDVELPDEYKGEDHDIAQLLRVRDNYILADHLFHQCLKKKLSESETEILKLNINKFNRKRMMQSADQVLKGCKEACGKACEEAAKKGERISVVKLESLLRLYTNVMQMVQNKKIPRAQVAHRHHDFYQPAPASESRAASKTSFVPPKMSRRQTL